MRRGVITATTTPGKETEEKAAEPGLADAIQQHLRQLQFQLVTDLGSMEPPLASTDCLSVYLEFSEIVKTALNSLVFESLGCMT